MDDSIAKMIDAIGRPDGKFNGNELKYILEFLDSQNPSNKQKSWASRFEEAFASKYGVKYAITHNSGTSTLHSCLAAAGVGAGDEVLSPAYCVVCLAFATLHQNAVPVFVDSDPHTFNIDPEDLERKITTKTKAVIVPHMHGLPCDMDRIMEISNKYKLVVIEDCAQTINVKYKGRYVGSIGHMASFSFEVKKHISTGQGGMVVTNNEEFASAVRKMAGLGYRALSATQRAVLPQEFQDPHYKRHDAVGWNYRMPEPCAAIGVAQFERVDYLVERRQAVAKMFLEAVQGCGWLTPQYTPPGLEHAYFALAMRYDGEEACGVSWREFYKRYIKNGGDGFYGAWTLQYNEEVMAKKAFLNGYLPGNSALYQGRFDYKSGLCPIAEEFQPRIMAFKTNYRDMETARLKAKALRRTVGGIDSRW